jgi:hypothetical protein
MVAGFPSEQELRPFWWLSIVSNHSNISTVSALRGHKKGHSRTSDAKLSLADFYALLPIENALPIRSPMP